MGRHRRHRHTFALNWPGSATIISIQQIDADGRAVTTVDHWDQEGGYGMADDRSAQREAGGITKRDRPTCSKRAHAHVEVVQGAHQQ